MSHTIAVYRHQLFKLSEVFIQKQVAALRKFKPYFIGRKLEGLDSGDIPTLTLANNGGPRDKARNLWHALSRDPSGFLPLLKDLKLDLVHAHFGMEGVYALGLSKMLDIPLVTTFHGVDATTTTRALLQSGKLSWIHYALFRGQLARRGDLFICVSNYIRNQLLALGFPEARVVKHYIGIDTSTIIPPSSKPLNKIILTVGRLVEKKGTCDLIVAFTELAKKDQDTQLVIIGDGPLRPKLNQLVTDCNLTQRVSFLGAQPHEIVLEWMGKASIFCLPSTTAASGDSEGLGMVFLEAAAMRVPSVATRHGGIPEAVEDDITGLLVPERSPAQLAERLKYLLDHDSIREEMGTQARRMVTEKFNIHKQTRKLEEMYTSLI